MAPHAALLLILALLGTFEAVRRGMAVFLELAAATPRGRRARGAGLADALSRVLSRGPLSRLRVAAQERERQRKLRAAMPDMLRLLCIALDSGSSLPRALEYAAENCEEPLAGELAHAVWDLKAGQGFDEAMAALRRRTGGAEFSYLAVAMEIQHRSGGSLSSVIEAVSSSLEKTARLEEALDTQTAQARLSARVVMLMPVAILLVLSVLSPGYLGAFFTSVLGVCLLVMAVLLECMGIVLVKRVLALDLSAGPLEEA